MGVEKVRAHKVKDVSETYGKQAWEYSDGSIRGEKGHMIVPLPGEQPITSERAPQMIQQAIEAKRRIISQAANDAVKRDDYRARFGDRAYIAELAYHAQRKATQAGDPKSIDAARFILQESGISERASNAPSDAQPSNSDLVEALHLIVRALEAVRPDRLRDVVEGQVTDV